MYSHVRAVANPRFYGLKDEHSATHLFVMRELTGVQRGLWQGKITALSTYDPRDLFSGDDVAMLRALEALLAAPQNNLKLFLDGSPVREDTVPETFDAFACGFGRSRVSLIRVIVNALKAEGVTVPVFAVLF
jgi:hypothetical protein